MRHQYNQHNQHNKMAILSKIGLYSLIVQCLLILTTLLPLSLKKVETQQDLDARIYALRLFVVLSSIWMFGMMFFMFKKYRLNGLIYSLCINLLMIMIITLIYWRNLQSLAQKQGLKSSQPYRTNTGAGSYFPTNENSSPFINPDKEVEMPKGVPTCSLDGNNLCH